MAIHVLTAERRSFALILALGLSVAMIVVRSEASAAGGTCRVRNRTAGNVYPFSGGGTLRQAINDASVDDVLTVRGVCVGHFSTQKKVLTIVGKPTSASPTATLDGGGNTRVLDVGYGTVLLRDLLITNGVADSEAGGIDTIGTLTLVSTVVADNRGPAGGIYNQGALTLRGQSLVTDNRAQFSGGGIFNFSGSVRMGDTASVSDNPGIGIYNQGTVALNASSSVSRNGKGGIYTEGAVSLNGSAHVTSNTETGIWIEEYGSLTMNGDSRVSLNVGKVGSGVRNHGVFGVGLRMHDQSRITMNEAVNGGGVYNDGSDIIMTGTSSISGNTARRDGGGIFGDEDSITMSGAASVHGNTAEGGEPLTPSGVGGGIRTCTSTLTGVNEGVNVLDNVPTDVEECP